MDTGSMAQAAPVIGARWGGKALLAAGVALMALTGTRWGSGALAWFVAVPFLLYARRAQGARAWGWLFAALFTGSSIQMAKIITYPLIYAFVPLFSLPLAGGMFAGLLAWRWTLARAGETAALYTFPALVVVIEWLDYTLTPLGTWGGFPNTQLENLPLLQLASLTGAAGLSFLFGWASTLMAGAIHEGGAWRWRRHIAAFLTVFAAANLYGSWRVHHLPDSPLVRVGAVVTDFIFTGAFPGAQERSAINSTLFERTRQAAGQGAKLVVWNEAATGVDPAEESALIAEGGRLTRALGIHMVMGYVVRLRHSPLLLENKYAWLDARGELLQTYVKHYIPPSEPSIAGDGPFMPVSTPWGVMAGAICYDYDNPHIAFAHGRLGAGLVALPSSDWEGIDPFHTQMTRIRAIENGYSILRSTRAAASAGFDAYGRTRGWMNYNGDNGRVMTVDLPSGQIETVYQMAGDLLVYGCGLFLALAALPGRLFRREV